MFKNIQIFRIAHAMATYAGARQGVIAGNIANADTPGYAAQDIAPFETLFDAAPDRFAPRATRAAHLPPPSRDPGLAPHDRPGAEADPNGNSVSLETEMAHAADTMRQHDRALAIYRSSLGILRSAIGRR